MRGIHKKKNLLFCLVDLHPHLFVQRGNFVSLAGVLGDLVIQILYIGCSCLELAVHTDVLALERYHGISPVGYMIGHIFIHFCSAENRFLRHKAPHLRHQSLGGDGAQSG
jgi:hypothetical protein